MYMSEFFEQQNITSELDQTVLIVVTKGSIKDMVGDIIDNLTDVGELENREGLFSDILCEVDSSVEDGYDETFTRKLGFMEDIIVEADSFFSTKEVLENLFNDNDIIYNKLVDYITNHKLSIPSLDEHLTSDDWKALINKRFNRN